MKFLISVVDKLLLFLYSIIIAVISVAAVCIGFEWITGAMAIDAIDKLYSNGSLQLTIIIIGIVLFLISLRFFIVSLSRGAISSQSVDQRTEYGYIRISIETMDILALNASMMQRGVKYLRSRVYSTNSE